MRLFLMGVVAGLVIAWLRTLPIRVYIEEPEPELPPFDPRVWKELYRRP